MKKDIVRSIVAVVAGFVFIGVTHTTIDKILESTGVLPNGHLNVSAGIILVVICYRAVFSFIGCYITAKLSPNKPMKHSIILGFIGLILSIVGAIVTAKMDVAPTWYGLALVLMALPIAWVAGGLFESRNRDVSVL